MRRALAILALALLVAGAGCSAFGPGEVNEQELSRNASYGDLWNRSTNATIALSGEEYRAVYRIENRSRFEIYGFRRLDNERPLDPAGVRFRYPDGRVVGPEAMTFAKTRSRTVVGLPARDGRLAYSAPAPGKEIRLAVLAEGTHEVILPPNTRVRYFLLGRVSPGGYERSIEDGRVHLRWEEVESDRIVVRYYFVRDLFLFGGLVAAGAAAVVGGLSYFWLQLRRLRRRREEVAIDPNDEF